MSTTDTDFWSRIDSASTPDEPSQPSLAIESSTADDEAADAPPSDESSRDATSHDATSDATSRDDSPATASQGEVSRPPAAASPKSKSQRIREFIDAHPLVRNRDIVDALGEHGVTAADVSNVRTQLRKKAEKQQRAKARVEASAGEPAASREAGRTRKTNRGKKASESATAPPSARAPSDEIAMAEIEAGLSFIEQAGSIERARQVVDLIARIRNVSLTR